MSSLVVAVHSGLPLYDESIHPLELTLHSRAIWQMLLGDVVDVDLGQGSSCHLERTNWFDFLGVPGQVVSLVVVDVGVATANVQCLFELVQRPQRMHG